VNYNVSLRRFGIALFLIGLLVFGISTVTVGEAQAKSECSDLTNLRIASTNLLSATIVPAGDGLPEYCRVMGYVRPSIQFEVRLPTSNWNGKYLLGGCGGACGNVDSDRPGITNSINYALRRNYAVAAHDSGHWGPSVIDAVWAYNNRQLEIDWGYRAVHEMARVPKELIQAYYGKKANYSYFAGCSTGGRQAGMEAQKFPEDFDGIISGAPDLNDTGLMLLLTWFYQANRDSHGKKILHQSRVKLVRDAVYAECDGKDGLVDGTINDPRNCDFKPESLLCKGSDTENCLSPEEIIVLKKFYGGVRNSAGELLFPGGMPLGSEPFWNLWAIGKGDAPGINDMFVEHVLRYKIFEADPGPTYSPMDFNFDRDPARMAFMGKIYNATNPNLSKFKKKGGKLLMYHGWADAIVIPHYSVEYYEKVVEEMGGLENTQDFFRLFMVPGMDHCSILPGTGPDQFDFLTELENWVEKGQPPERIIGSQLDKERKKVVRTRPMCPYPKMAKYKGSGSIDDAANFVCADQ
jgi:feruloyl esterase